ncbi:MAG: hypothetical protein KAS07_03060 [Candidatus Pacebacteria bacterium]|nr:hypothetical protein [Candidatus Paceibacterota bacterium]
MPDEKKIGKKRKYNFANIKNKFFLSEIGEVKMFFETKYGAYNPYIQTNTAGWTKEKNAWKKKIAQDAMKKLTDKQTKKYEKGLESLMRHGILPRLKKDELEGKSEKSVKILWEIMMTMNSKPTRVTKQEITAAVASGAMSEEQANKVNEILKENGDL